MTPHALAVTVTVLVVVTGSRTLPAAERAKNDSRQTTIRLIDQTTLVGDLNPVLWKKVLDVLPVRPRRIEVLDLDSLSIPTRQKLRGLDGFVLAGQTTIVVVRQGATLRQAEFGDAVDRLILASLVWHEMAHANGSDERAAFVHEQALWHRFIAAGLVSADVGLAYIARLREALGYSLPPPDISIQSSSSSIR